MCVIFHQPWLRSDHWAVCLVIPYTKLFKPKACPGCAPPTNLPEPVKCHDFIHANVTSIEAHRVNFVRLSAHPCGVDTPSYVDFDYLVYALGSHLPAPINIWSPSQSIGPGVGPPCSKSCSKLREFQTPDDSQDPLLPDDSHDGTKAKSRQWLQTAHYRIKAATSLLVIGGGALGVREYNQTPFCCKSFWSFDRVCDWHSWCLPKQGGYPCTFPRPTASQFR